MWLEKPHEEEVCKELSDNYAKLHELQKHSEQMMNRSRYFFLRIIGIPKVFKVVLRDQSLIGWCQRSVDSIIWRKAPESKHLFETPTWDKVTIAGII